jgi:AcrR family transcriptional regulator
VQTVGIDRVIEHAGVAKASLYNTFGSKENLVRAYLEGRHEGTVDTLRRSVERHGDPRQRLLAMFDAQAEMFAEPSFRGCAFITASAEAPDGGLIEHAADD